MADKEEEKKPTGFDEFELEELKKRARDKKKELLHEGYTDKDAHEYAILYVKLSLQFERRRELIGDLSYCQKRLAKERLSDREKNFTRDKIKEISKEYHKVNDSINQLKDKIDKIEKKKNLYYGKSFSEIESERVKQLNEIERDLREKNISKEEYEDKIKKKEEHFEDILKIKREKDREEGFIDSTGALGFECPECHEPFFESFDKNGHAVLKCKTKDCANQGREFHPRDFQRGNILGVPGVKTPWRPGIWKPREAGAMAAAYGDRKKRLRQLLERGDITKKEYKTEKKKAHKEIYGDKETYDAEIEKINEEKRLLDNRHIDRTISDEEYEREYKALEERRREVTKKYGPKGMKFVRGASALARFSHTGEDYIKKVIFLVALIGIGAVVSASFGNLLFFLGFLSVACYYLTPPPEAFEREGGKLSWDHVNPFGRGGQHATFSWLKSIFKVAAILCFAFAFRGLGDLFNIFFIITCLGGYFILKREYDPKQPGEFIESLLRFGILGCYFIPFYVFAGIFNSYVLAAIALAFFAIPPMPNTSKDQNLTEVLSRGLSGQTAYYEMFDKILFLGLMLFALIGSGSLGALSFFNVGWQLEGTLKYTFIYFWIISAIGGFFSPARERPLTGMLFLGGATIIYGIGPGSQDIGSALLGQWWPTVNEAVTTISEPINKMFGTLGKTFGDAFLLLTNPVGYATQLMNGSYSNNPVGETGAYGVELTGFEVSPVFIEQPFMITTNVKNNGAYNAENLAIALSVGLKAPEKQTSVGTPSISTPLTSGNPLSWPTTPLKISEIGIKDSTCDRTASADETICIHKYKSESDKDIFTRQNIWQTVFSSSAGITCDVSARYELRKKSIPINVTLTYKYQSDSKVTVEFISQAEWDRLARLDQLNSRLQFIKSEYSSSPVKFPIGTPGLKNPILETQDFHIALNVQSDQQGGRIEKLESVQLNYPEDFKYDSCSPEPSNVPGNSIIWSWDTNTKKSGDQILFCHFEALKQGTTSKLGGSPTKTYVITAHANYTYAKSQQKLVKVEFGSWCCASNTLNPKDECTSGSKCCSEQYPGQSKGKGICIPLAQQCGTGQTPRCEDFIRQKYNCEQFSKQIETQGLKCTYVEATGECITQQLVTP